MGHNHQTARSASGLARLGVSRPALSVAISLQILSFSQFGFAASAQAPLPGGASQAEAQQADPNFAPAAPDQVYAPGAAPDILKNAQTPGMVPESREEIEATAAAANADAAAATQETMPPTAGSPEKSSAAPVATVDPSVTPTTPVAAPEAPVYIPNPAAYAPDALNHLPFSPTGRTALGQPILPASATAPLAPAGAPTAAAVMAPNPAVNQTPAVSAVVPAVPAPTSKDFLAWEKLEQAGEKALWNNEYGNAERLFTQAVIKARTFNKGDSRLAKSSGQLGRLLTMRRRFAEAEPYLEEELKVKELAFGNGDGKLIPSMASMVKFYLVYGNQMKADPLTEKILDYVEGRLSAAADEATGGNKTHLKAGQPLKGWAGEAAPVMRTPLIDWAIACDDIGNLYSARSGLPENFALADRLYKAALDVKATVLGKQHLSLANSYDSLGSLALLRQHDQEAESYFQDALEITERIQPSTQQVFNRVDKLARVKVKLGKLDEAEALYIKAAGVWHGEPSNNGSEARAAYALGALYCQEKKFAQAGPVLARALAAAQHNSGPDSIAIVPYLQKLAYAEYYLGNRGESDNLKARANAIAPPAPPPEPTLTMKARSLDQ
jgi:tetratricopeptide (TPR) repeat protein